MNKSELRAQAWEKTTGYDCRHECPGCNGTMYPFDCRLDKYNNPVCKQCSNIEPRVGKRQNAWENRYENPAFRCMFGCGRKINLFVYDLCRDRAGCIGGKYKIKNCFVACHPCNMRQGKQSINSYKNTIRSVTRDGLIGCIVKKWFDEGMKYYYGEVVAVDTVQYDDGDVEIGCDIEQYIVDEDPCYRMEAYKNITEWYDAKLV